MFEKVKTVMDMGSVGQYSGREDVLLNLLSQIDLRYLKLRPDYPLIKSNLDTYKLILTESKIRNSGLKESIDMQVSEIEKHYMEDERYAYYKHRGKYGHYDSGPNPRRFQNRGPKSYPCKYFHGIRGCSSGDSCEFIHEEKYKGIRIPYPEMERVINKQ
jgi:hypothetical protein